MPQMKVKKTSVEKITELRFAREERRALASVDWPKPILYDDPRAITFPVHALPPDVARFVTAEAEATQTPVDLPAMLCLSALAAACAAKFTVLVRPGYREPLNLFVVVALAPGERKSAVFRDVFAPFVDAEREAVDRDGPNIAVEVATYEALAEKIKTAKRQLATAEGGAEASLQDEIRRLTKDFAARTMPVIPRLCVDDVTPEKIALMLAEQQGRLCVASAEGTIFDVASGLYSNGTPNIDVLLKGHAGDDIRVDRMGRPSIVVPRPALTLALAVQPDVVRTLSAKKQFRGKGLLARFLFSLPTTRVGERNFDSAPVPNEIRARYAYAVKGALSLPVPVTAPDLNLTAEALSKWKAFGQEIEGRLHRHKGDLSPIGDWGAKLTGAVARIAALLHVITQTSSGERRPESHLIESRTLEAAIEIGHYTLAHARMAFMSMGTTEDTEDDAKKIFRWLRTRATLTPVSVREIQRNCRALRKDTIDAALDELIERNIVRALQTPSIGSIKGGRPASLQYQPNPLAIPLPPQMPVTKPTKPT